MIFQIFMMVARKTIFIWHEMSYPVNLQQCFAGICYLLCFWKHAETFLYELFSPKERIVHSVAVTFSQTQIPKLKHPQHSSICSYVILLLFISSGVIKRSVTTAVYENDIWKICSATFSGMAEMMVCMYRVRRHTLQRCLHSCRSVTMFLFYRVSLELVIPYLPQSFIWQSLNVTDNKGEVVPVKRHYLLVNVI